AGARGGPRDGDRHADRAGRVALAHHPSAAYRERAARARWRTWRPVAVDVGREDSLAAGRRYRAIVPARRWRAGRRALGRTACVRVYVRGLGCRGSRVWTLAGRARFLRGREHDVERRRLPGGGGRRPLLVEKSARRVSGRGVHGVPAADRPVAPRIRCGAPRRTRVRDVAAVRGALWPSRRARCRGAAGVAARRSSVTPHAGFRRGDRRPDADGGNVDAADARAAQVWTVLRPDACEPRLARVFRHGGRATAARTQLRARRAG